MTIFFGVQTNYSTNICLKYHAYIDPQFENDAKIYISEYFHDISAFITCDIYEGLIIISSEKLDKSIKKQYANLSIMYVGHILDLSKKITELENQLLLKDVRHNNQLKDKEIELMNKDILIQEAQHKNKLKDKDIELLQLELQLATMKK